MFEDFGAGKLGTVFALIKSLGQLDMRTFKEWFVSII